MSPFRSPTSTRWVLWSSPLLLLVLVFTLSASSPSGPRAKEASLSNPTTSSVTSTTTLARSSAPRSGTTTTTTTTTSSTTTTLPSTTTPVARTATSVSSDPSTSPTRGRSGAGSRSGTPPSAAPSASASVAGGALDGRLTPADDLAVVPLAGPGTWSLVASAPVTATLQCGSVSAEVTSEFTIGADQHCQVSIIGATPGATLTWQLSPIT